MFRTNKRIVLGGERLVEEGKEGLGTGTKVRRTSTQAVT